jgi:DNA-binding transcriptional ArsR family regulator
MVCTVRASHLDATFAALADPTRRALLARLAAGEAGVMQLAKPFNMSQPAVSKHLKVLERAGLIVRGRRAQSRPCRLQAAPLREVADWIERYRRYWEQSFDRLDAYLGKLQQQDKLQRQEKRRGRKSTN